MSYKTVIVELTPGQSAQVLEGDYPTEAVQFVSGEKNAADSNVAGHALANIAPVHTTDDVRAYNTMKIDNNAQGVIASLTKYGYPTDKGIGRQALSEKLLKIYFQNKKLYLNILAAAPFNEQANNYTTSPAFKSKMSAALAQWKKDGYSNSLGGSTHTTVTTTVTQAPVAQAPASKAPIYIGVTVAIALIVTLVIIK